MSQESDTAFSRVESAINDGPLAYVDIDGGIQYCPPSPVYRGFDREEFDLAPPPAPRRPMFDEDVADMDAIRRIRRNPERLVRRQGLYWLLTISCNSDLATVWRYYLPDDVAYIKGQKEKGAESGFEHWQLLVIMHEKCSLHKIREIFGPVHAELTYSRSSEDYVWKEETRVEGTRFEIGEKPLRYYWDII